MFTIPCSRPAYPLEFPQKMVELLHADRSLEELAQEFEPTAQTDPQLSRAG